MEKEVIKNQVVKNVQMKRPIIPAVDIEAHRPFIECMVLAIEDDPRLKEFFGVLEKQVGEVIRFKGIDSEKQERKFAEIVEAFYKKRVEIVSKLSRTGVRFEENFMGPSYTLHNFDDTFERREFNYASEFNGLMLSLHKMQNPEETRAELQEKYDRALERQAEMAKESEETKRKLRSPKVIFGGIKKYKGLVSNLRYLKSHKNFADVYKRDLETFESFTPEQKELIIQYFEATDSIDKGVSAIRELQKTRRNAAPPLTDLSVMDKALDRMVEGGMTEEDLAEVFNRIDKIRAQRNAGAYDERKYVEKRGLSLMKTFLKNVYGHDPRSIESDEKALDERDE